MRYRYFISDLHLSDKNLDMYKKFHKFIDIILPEINELYILGDLFEYWINNEIITQENQKVLECLKQTAMKGVKIYFMVGNRDFLISKELLGRYNITLLDEPYYLEDKYCLLHGDSLCTTDYSYQKYKKVVRSEKVKKWILGLSKEGKERLASTLRKISGLSYFLFGDSANDESAINNAVMRLWEQNKFELMLHGHTHMPDIHAIDNNACKTKRLVIGDWGNSYNVVRIKDDVVERFTW